MSSYWVTCSYTRNQHQGFNFRALIAWVCGLGVMIVPTHPQINLLGVVIAAAVYWVAVVVARAGARRSVKVF